MVQTLYFVINTFMGKLLARNILFINKKLVFMSKVKMQGQFLTEKRCGEK